MKKKKFERPTVNVVKMQNTQLLMTSGGQASVQDYGWNEYEEE